MAASSLCNNIPANMITARGFLCWCVHSPPSHGQRLNSWRAKRQVQGFTLRAAHWLCVVPRLLTFQASCDFPTDRFACVLPLLQYACCVWHDVVIFLADLVALAVQQIGNVLPLDPSFEIFYVPSTLRRAHHGFPILSSPGLHFSWHSTHAETVSAKPVGMVSELTLPRVLATRRG